MNTKEKELAHECAEKGAHYQQAFTKHKHYELIFAAIMIPLGLFTLPFGALFLIVGGMSIAMAIVSSILAEQAHKDYFDIREDIIEHGTEEVEHHDFD